MSAGRVALPLVLPIDPAILDKLTINASVAAYMAGHMAKHWIEKFARRERPVTAALRNR